jgi:hypothetical protein
MKSQTKTASVKKPLRKTSAKRGVVRATASLLPAWVVGCYDGPSDGKLSVKKAYVR